MSGGKNMNIISAFKVLQSRKRKAGSPPPDAKTSLEADVELTLKQIIENIEHSSDKITNDYSNCNGHVDKKMNTAENELFTSSEKEKSFCNGDSDNLSISSSFKSSDTSFSSSIVASPQLSLSSQQKKKRKRMSPEEAKRKTELRLEKEKLKEERRQQILSKKEEKIQERIRKEEEKKKAKIERQQKKEEEERLKEKLRQEKKEQEEREKQQKLHEKEELLKLKHLIQEAKAEEKKKKEMQRMKLLEDKLKALEEKKKIEDEKMRLELENEKKKAKTKQAFEKFFVKTTSVTPGSTSVSPPQTQIKESFFLPFQVSEAMVLAPVVRTEAKNRFDKNQLDHYLIHQIPNASYIKNLKSSDYVPFKFKKEKSENKNSEGDLEIIIIEPKSTLKAKLLQFHENIRPPYWGTWRKKSKFIKPRKPFGMDTIFDYEVDSDEEWDEGGPGESLNGTEDEESEDDYEVDNEFFVPHGYLSAEEEGEDEDVQQDPETQKARLKLKEKEFLSERNKKTTELKPIILGCFFKAEVNEGDSALEKVLLEFQAEFITTKDILTSYNKLNLSDFNNSATSPSDGKTPSNVKRAVPEEAMPFLIRLLHGNTSGRQILIKEFQKFWLEHQLKNKISKAENEAKENTVDGALSPNIMVTPTTAKESFKISKRQLDMCITTIATWCKPLLHPTFKKLCWMVKEEVLQKYELNDLPIPNEWTSKTQEGESIQINSSQ